MYKPFIFLLYLNFCISCENKTGTGSMLSIEKTRTDTVIKDIPLKRNGKLPAYYLNKPNVERQLGLNTLENGFDSIQIRIWYGYAFIDTSQLVILKNNNQEWVAELITFKYHTDNSIDSVKAIDKTSVKSQPKSGWSNFINKLFSLKITELPDFSKVKNYHDIMDGDDVIVEISTVNSYRIFSYKEPRHFKERIPEAKRMELILELVEDEFGFLRLRKL